MAGKFTWSNEGKHCWVLLTNFLFSTICWPQVNFPIHNLNFHWRWWDRIQAILLNLFYFKKWTSKSRIEVKVSKSQKIFLEYMKRSFSSDSYWSFMQKIRKYRNSIFRIGADGDWLHLGYRFKLHMKFYKLLRCQYLIMFIHSLSS